jgi:acetyl esterase/lipase
MLAYPQIVTEHEDRAAFDRFAPNPTSELHYGSGPDQLLEIFGTGQPGIAFIHGGYWRPEYDRSHARPAVAELARALESPVANIEYRRIPGDPDASIDDITSAVQSLRNLTGTPIVLIGHSAGAHLALCVQHKIPEQITAVIALAPVTNLAMAQSMNLDDAAITDFLGGSAHDRPDLDPHTFIVKSVAVTVIHGDADIRVPVEMSRNLNIDDYLELIGVGHFELIDPMSPHFNVVLEATRKRIATAEA